MTSAHRRYIAIEASIGAAISGVLSIAFCFLIFGGVARVPALGVHGLALDALPQSFMIALMASLVPTLLTRGRVRRGVVDRRVGTSRLPRHVALRAFVVALTVAVIAGAVHLALLSAGPPTYPFGPVLIAKTLYGAALGWLVAAWATRAALADPHA